MKHVLYLVSGVEGIEKYPELAVHIGGFVTRYEPFNAPKGEQWIWTDADIRRAIHFRDFQKAHEFWTTAIGVRPDGKPDRPLTIYHVQIQPVEEESPT